MPLHYFFSFKASLQRRCGSEAQQTQLVFIENEYTTIRDFLLVLCLRRLVKTDVSCINWTDRGSYQMNVSFPLK